MRRKLSNYMATWEMAQMGGGIVFLLTMTIPRMRMAPTIAKAAAGY
jgi:hypothetical protein